MSGSYEEFMRQSRRLKRKQHEAELALWERQFQDLVAATRPPGPETQEEWNQRMQKIIWSNVPLPKELRPRD